MLWLVSVEKVDYDQYDAFVVRAKDAADAQRLASDKFEKWQLEGGIAVEHIPGDGPDEIILGSFNAG